MTTPVINTTSGETIKRELMVLYLNVSDTSTPSWKAIGKRVEDSSVELDWSSEASQDILGNAFITAKKPIITQTFEPYYIDAGDDALKQIFDIGILQQDVSKLCNQDVLLVHFYAGAAATPFAERYASSAILPTSIGGEGGGNVQMTIEVTFGGTRSTGTVTKAGDTITFNAAGGAT